jgi:hypothetical protein
MVSSCFYCAQLGIVTPNSVGLAHQIGTTNSVQNNWREALVVEIALLDIFGKVASRCARLYEYAAWA